ncbi:MAG: extracellular solute-binding protein [Ectothiorhodospiraceae bacterium]|nr:extracellular solute-binding protein [Ectothiorhodospiraceae bacterium]
MVFPLLLAVGVAGIVLGGVRGTGGQDEAAAVGDEVVVYSSRQEHLIRPLFERFTEETGIRVRYTTDNAGALMARLQSEGRNTQADLFMTVDAGNLWQAAERGLLAPMESELLTQAIPVHLRDPDGHWFGLSVRARTLVYSTERVDPEALRGYADLADEQWRGRLCLRSSQSVYNQSLVAMLIASHGVERTEEIVKGWVANLAAQPFSNDTSTMEAVVAGQCDVALVNTYYFGRLQSQNPDVPLAVHWADQEGNGVHVNISGAGVTRHAQRPGAARKLLEWLAGEEAQALYGALNHEYPAREGIDWDPLVASWGDYRVDDTNLAEAGRLQTQAVMLMDRAGYR